MASSQDEVYRILLDNDRPMTCREIMNEMGIKGKSSNVYHALYQLEKFKMVESKRISPNENNEHVIWVATP